MMGDSLWMVLLFSNVAAEEKDEMDVKEEESEDMIELSGDTDSDS